MNEAFSGRRPLYLGLSIVLLVAYVGWTVLHFYIQYREAIPERNRLFTQRLINQASSANILLERGDLNELREQLAEGVKGNEIYAYRIENDDKSIYTYDPNEVLPLLETVATNQILNRGEIRYIVIESGDSRALIAIYMAGGRHFPNFVRQNMMTLLRDIATVLLIAAFILSYFLKDISQILLALHKGDFKKLTTIRSRTDESEALLKSVQSMNLSLKDLEAQNRQLRNQVLSALNSELMSGRKPPYEFDCTLVRVDVNNFSHIFSTYPIEEFMTTINLFFEEVTEIVSRYRGYVYEFVGDEVIFYFKDDEHASSTLMAMAALKDIREAAVHLDTRVVVEQGYHFRVKASLAHGRLRFGPQVSGFSLAGAILIETVRILSQISDKEDNVIFYDESIARKIDALVESRPQKVVVLKGLAKAHSLYSYVSHQPLAKVLESLRIETADHLNSFRSDRDLITVLDTLRTDGRVMDIKLYLAMCRRLRNFKVPRTSSALSVAFARLMQHLIDRCESEESNEHDLFRLSSTLTLGAHVLDSETFERDLKAYYKTCLLFADRRVVANSLDVFSSFASLDEDAVFIKLLRARDNRIAANALVKEGIKGLTRSITKQIRAMLGSKDPLFVASALYVIGELARFHRSRNPIHYDTHVGFQSLIQKLRQYVGHENEMIRRQALIAARKTQDLRLKEAIEAFYLEGANATTKLEIERLFLQPETRTPPSSPSGGAGSTAA